jgi:DNA (cytosine-5)-methyltransferase 1
MSSFNVLDMFCGAGGMSHGFIEAGFNVALGLDSSKDAIETFKKNHVNSFGLVSDLFHDTPEFIVNETGISSFDLIIGGPPCQGFSIAGKRDINDERNELYKSFVKFVCFFRPKAFVMENVPNILSMGKGVIKENIINDFESFGYNVKYKVLMASDYGVPQNRRRAFFVGVLNNSDFLFPKPNVTNPITSYEAISDLPENGLQDGDAYPTEPFTEYQATMRLNSIGVYNHQITKHTEKTKSIISLVPDGGNYKNLPEELKKTRNVNIAWTRLNSSRPSFTIDTGHRHHFHYAFPRVPTVREAARIQSFKDDFIFTGSQTTQNRLVGNAVPPLLAKSIALQLKDLLNV